MIKNLGKLLIIFLTAVFTDVMAQNSQVMYYMNLPQNHLLNPALRPSNTFYIGLPGLSGVNVNVSNNFIRCFSDVFMHSELNDSIITFLHPDYNADDFLAKIKDRNSIEPEAGVQLFSLGFNAGNDIYMFIDIIERVQGNVVIPRDLMELAMKGNEGFIGSKIDLSSLRGDMKYFREAGFGFSGNISTRLRLGVRGKLLFGMAAASIKNRSLGIQVNDDYTHTFNADLSVNLSGPVKVLQGEDNSVESIEIDDSKFDSDREKLDYLLNTSNFGLGLDFGAEYSITDRIIVSAAITDLGYIPWKSDVSNLIADTSFIFRGFNLTDVIEGSKTFEEIGDEVLDSLKNSLRLAEGKSRFTTYLPAGITLGGQYKLTKNFSIGLLSYSRLIGKQLKESLSLSANLNLGNALSTSISYTMANQRYDNIGAGLSLRAGIFQLYVVGDKIPVRWNKILTDGNKIPLPETFNTLNLRAGMNLTFGNRVKVKNDRPMVVVE
jgi:hypothetical protein